MSSKGERTAHCLKLEMDSAVCSQMDRCLENGGDRVFSKKGNRGGWGGGHSRCAPCCQRLAWWCPQTWRGFILTMTYLIRHIVETQQTTRPLQPDGARTSIKAVRCKLNFQHAATLRVSSRFALFPSTRLPNPCVYQCVKLHQSTFFFNLQYLSV